MAEYLGMEVRDLNRKLSLSTLRVVGTNDFIKFIDAVEPGERDRGREVRIAIPDIRRNRWNHINVGFDIFDTLSLDFPLLGYFDHGGCSYYLQRKAARQWHVGFNESVTDFPDSFQEEREACGLYHPDMLRGTPKFINDIFNRRYRHYNSIINDIREGNILSGSISPFISISQSLKFDDPLVVYKTKPIGFIQRNDVPVIFPPAEYTADLFPIQPDIREDYKGVTLRNKRY